MKLFIAVFIVYCGVQVYAAPPDTSEQDFEDSFNSVIKKLNDSLNDATQWVNEQSQKLENAIGGEVKKGFDIVDQKIQEVTKEATEKGIDIGPCVDKQKKNVDGYIDSLSKSAVGCISDKLKDGISYLQSVINAISATEQALVDAKDSIKACDKKSKLKKAECIAKETAKAVGKAADADKTAVEDIGKLSVLYSDFPNKLKQCELDVLGKVGEDAKKVAEDVALCVIF